MFASKPHFEILPDGTFYARHGVQTNCAGIAAVHLRIELNSSGCLTIQMSDSTASTYDSYAAVPGSAVPKNLTDAFFRGVQIAFDEHANGIGASVELIDALVHPVDANPGEFTVVGITAMNRWLELRAPESYSGPRADE